jgi:hypothetical protein
VVDGVGVGGGWVAAVSEVDAAAALVRPPCDLL